jgi:hypothetical protein
MTGLMVLFFSFYFYTTWRGRYFLPILYFLAPVGCAALFKKPHSGLRTLATATLYYAMVCAILLYPLSGHARAPAVRARDKSANFDYFQPEPSHESILVQEVQGAYYYPTLRYISTDGLIAMEAFRAWQKDMTVYEFALEERPDLVGVGEYYLRDPEEMGRRIRQAMREKANVRVGKIALKYSGILRGCGHVFEAKYLLEN